jgi:hypothetical protein
MVRVPVWAHLPVARRGAPTTDWQPGWRGTGMRRPLRPAIGAYSQRLTGVPIAGATAQVTVQADGSATAQVAPQGLGTTWYPQQANISTSTGADDSSTCAIYLGASALNSLQVGQSYAGGGDTVGLSVPALTPGGLLIAVWTGGVPGDLATLSIIGTQDALSS